jgi:hypothetical protein
MKRSWLILAAFLGLAIQAAPASAAVTYSLSCTTILCTGPGTGTYGTVTLTQSGASGSEKVNVSVVLASGYQFGSNNTHALLWNGLTNDTLSVSNYSSNASSFGVLSSGANGSYAASPFTGSSNNFDYAVDRANNSGSPTSLSFDVTKSGGLTLANFATDNDGGGFFFAAFIHKNSTDTNFYVASNQVPEPGTLMLSVPALAALAGLAVLRRRRYRAVLPGQIA